jgi:hypothetical protein
MIIFLRRYVFTTVMVSDNDFNNFQMVSHYVGHQLLIARWKKGEIAEDTRKKLILSLETLTHDSLVNNCIDFLKESDWHCPGAVECFNVWYDKEVASYRAH